MTLKSLSGTLGERHEHFNKAVSKLCSEKKDFKEIDGFSPKSDIDHLIKIDAANHFKDLDYIYQILKSDDDLLKSRAMKCVWLFNGSLEFSRLSYMNDNLFPFISNNTKCRVIHKLCIHLKNEEYAEEYYNHFFKSDDRQHAFKILPSCSTKFIKQVFDTTDIKLTATQLNKIIEKDMNLSYIYFNTKTRTRNISQFSKAISLMASADTERFLNWFENTLIPEGLKADLGIKTSSKIMQIHKRRVIDSINKYVGLLKKDVIINALSHDEIKEVLLKLLPRKKELFKNEYSLFFDYTKKLSQDEQNDLLNNIYKTFFGIEIPQYSLFYHSEWRKLLNPDAIQKWALYNVSNKIPWLSVEQPRLFMWFSHVDFEIAFPRLRDYVKAETQPKERMHILTTMLDSYCKRRREEDLTKLLQYFLKFHINEIHRHDFLYKLLDHTVIYKYNEESWSTVNEMFHSFEVYDSKEVHYSNRYTICRCQSEVVRHHLLKGIAVPKNFMKLYINSSPTYSVHSKDIVDMEFEEKFFNTVCNALLERFLESEPKEKADALNDFVDYLRHWNERHPKHSKSLVTYKPILEYIKTNKESSFYPITMYLKTDKSLLREIFEVNMSKAFSETITLYCLKHRPELLNGSNEETVKSVSETWFQMKGLYRKLRTYFPDDLGKFWVDFHLKSVEDNESKNLKLRNSVLALSLMLEKDKFIEVIKPYMPSDAKIQWSEIDKNILERSKLIAKYSHFVRPLLPPNIILPFAKGDYLQHILTSLTSLCYQYSLPKTKEVMMILIDSPVSVQKHGIRMLMTLFDSTDTTKMIMDIWSKTKNLSIRFVILQYLTKIMVKVHQSETRERYWLCLKAAIGQLSGEGDDKLFEHLSENVGHVHKENVTDYCECSWYALKKFGNQGYLLKFLIGMRQRQKDLSGEFCTKLIREYIESNFAEEPKFEKDNLCRYDVEMLGFIVEYLLFVKEEPIQNERIRLAYEVLTKQLKKFWKNNMNNSKPAKKYYIMFLKNVLVQSFSLTSEHVNARKFLNHILADMSTFLPLAEGFNEIIITKLVCLVHEVFDPLRSVDTEYNEELKPEVLKSISESWQVFGKRSGDLLIELMENYFPQISVLFQDVFRQFVNVYMHYGCFNMNLTENFLVLNIAKGFISHEGHIYSILAGIQILPKKVDDKFSKPIHEQILKQLKESKKPEILFFLNYIQSED